MALPVMPRKKPGAAQGPTLTGRAFRLGGLLAAGLALLSEPAVAQTGGQSPWKLPQGGQATESQESPRASGNPWAPSERRPRERIPDRAPSQGSAEPRGQRWTPPEYQAAPKPPPRRASPGWTGRATGRAPAGPGHLQRPGRRPPLTTFGQGPPGTGFGPGPARRGGREWPGAGPGYGELLPRGFGVNPALGGWP